MACNLIRLQLDGTNQNERLTDALQPDNVRIDDRSGDELYRYIYQLAGQLAYYNFSGERAGNWQKLLPANYALLEQQSASQPHLSLLWVFLRLFTGLQKDINLLTGKHLDYFYQQFLGFVKARPIGDQVYLQFELNKTADLQLLEKGTRFPAGKLGDTEIYYTLDNEVVINRAVIAALQSLLIDPDNEDRIYMAPVANSLDGVGKKMLLPGQAWRPFGESQFGKAPEDRTMLPARVGFALASPVLSLAEGRRNVSITFTVKNGDLLPYFNNVFKIILSGVKGWLAPIDVNMTRDSTSFTLSFFLDDRYPAVTAPGVLLPEDRFAMDHPIALVLIDEARSNHYFASLMAIRISRIDIRVQVDGLRKSCTLENDQSTLDPSKNFQPFGAIPALGSTFTVRSAEVTAKTISRLRLSMNWKELPQDLDAYYTAYGVTHSNFIAQARIQFNHAFDALNFYLFDHPPIDQASFSYTPADLHTDLTDYRPFYPDELFSLILNNPTAPVEAFGHRQYPGLLSNAVATIAAGDPATIPNPPYTPVAGDFSLAYDAQADLTQITLYQVEPFGVQRGDTTQASFPLFPQWEETAALFIGLQGLPTPSQLNMLWQIAQTGDNGEAPPPITWSVLKGNSWYPLSSLEVLVDQTLNWQQTGIISLDIMDTASNVPTTILDPGLVWIKASVQASADQVRSIVSVWTQAAAASLPDEVLPDPFMDEVLPAGTIQKTQQSLPAIKKVQQPLDSFGGRPSESGDHFYARVSERLRHKNRAICLWDYEHMVLEQFPQLFKVKCLVHADAGNDRSPGNVALIVIPGFTERASQANPFEPSVSLVLKQKIANYIRGYTSPHVDVFVQTPVYEQVLVDMHVKFREGFDPGYYRGLLVTYIQRLLSPWAFESGKDILFENKIYKSVLWSAIELLDYVDYIADFKLYHAHEGPETDGIGCMEIGLDFKVWEAPYSLIGEDGVPRDNDMIIGDSFVVGYDSEQAIASTSRSILVSSLYHRVDVLQDSTAVCQGAAGIGIGQMIIEWDFVVAGDCIN